MIHMTETTETYTVEYRDTAARERVQLDTDDVTGAVVTLVWVQALDHLELISTSDNLK
jgi:hypothetical protein